jgi:D-lactate dehydrogenase (cytochrome)
MVKIFSDIEFINEYLRDESRLTGKADSVSFPESEAEIQEALEKLAAISMPVTVQGSRTGITGGAVPLQGHILNLSRMNRIVGLRYEHPDSFFLTVQPGLKLQELSQALQAKSFGTSAWSKGSLAALDIFKKQGPYFFPPDPTETTASLGGMAACNASGARSFHYGATRNYINALQIILADGSKLWLRRGQDVSSDGNFLLPDRMEQPGQQAKTGSRTIQGRLPSYKRAAVKNAAGYFTGQNIDLLDLFIGAEGTLGIISGLEIKLIPAPKMIWGGVFFFTQEQKAVAFVNDLKKDGFLKQQQKEGSWLAVIEFFDRRSLSLVSTLAHQDLPAAPLQAAAALYLEIHGQSEDNIGACFLHIAELVTKAGEDAEANWLAANAKQLKKLTDFRHAVPEAINLLLDSYKKEQPELTKLGTDMAVGDEKLMEVYKLYHSLLDPSGLDFAMFGHIGDNHIHVNIIPKTGTEYLQGKELYNTMARSVLAMGGTISAEHGIGKLKRELLAAMYGEEGLKQMRELKTCFDPQWLLSRGNLFFPD